LSAGGATHHHHHHHQQQQQQQQQNQNDVVHDGSTVASTTSTVATSPVIPPTLQFTRTLCHQQQHAPSIASSHRDLHPNPIQQHSNNSSSSSLSAKLFSIIKRDQPATAAQPITSTGGLQGKRQPEDFIFLAEFSQLYVCNIYII
jgi:hypothetical protein